MNLALSFAENFLMDKLANGKSTLTLESKLKSSLSIFSILMALGAIIFLMVALYIWLIGKFSLVATMIGMGGALIALSFLSLLIILGMSKYKHHKIKEKRNELISFAEEILKYANNEISEPIEKNPLTSVMIASVAGYIVGEKTL